VEPAPMSAARGWTVGLLVAAGLVVAAGWHGSGEFSAHGAFDASRRQPLSALMSHILLVEPVDAPSFRPLNVLLVRLFGGLGDPSHPLPNLLKGGAEVGLWLFAGWMWLRRRLPPEQRAAALLIALAAPAALFDAWHAGEWGLLGAALILLADEWMSPDDSGHRPTGRLVASGAAWLAALLLKDSVAVIALCVLGLRALEAWRAERRLDGPAAWFAAAGASLLAVFFFTSPPWGQALGPATALQGGPPVDDPLGQAGRAATVALAQVVALVGVAGVVAVAATALRKRVPGPALLAVVALALLAPEPARFDLFQCFVFDSVAWVWGVGGVLLVAAAVASSRSGPSTDGPRWLLLTLAAFVALPLLLRVRADVSARVFLPILVPVAAWLVAAVTELSGEGRASRIAGIGLAVGLGLQAVGGAVGFGSAWLALEATELEAKRALVDAVVGPTVVATVSRERLTTLQELSSLGLPPDARVRRAATVFPADRPDGQFAVGALAYNPGLRSLLSQGVEDLLVLDVGLRSRAAGRGRASLAGTFAPGGPWPVPPHSFEDDHFRVYSELEPVPAWVDGRAETSLLAEPRRAVLRPPTRWSDLTGAIVLGRPLVERLEARSLLYRIEGR